MSHETKININLFIDTFEDLARVERHHQSILGIKKSEARVLLCIDYLTKEAKSKVNISEISKHLSITSPSTTEFVKNLIAKGYVERRIDACDRRYVELFLTHEGQQVTAAINTYFNSLFSGLVKELGVAESQQLIALLSKVNTYLNEWYKGPK